RASRSRSRVLKAESDVRGHEPARRPTRLPPPIHSNAINHHRDLTSAVVHVTSNKRGRQPCLESSGAQSETSACNLVFKEHVPGTPAAHEQSRLCRDKNAAGYPVAESETQADRRRDHSRQSEAKPRDRFDAVQVEVIVDMRVLDVREHACDDRVDASLERDARLGPGPASLIRHNGVAGGIATDGHPPGCAIHTNRAVPTVSAA